jgi:hypothetical protein
LVGSRRGKPAQNYVFLKIFWLQSGSFGNPTEHAWFDLIVIVNCENVIWPLWTGEDTVGSFGFTLDGPADLQKSSKHAP